MTPPNIDPIKVKEAERRMMVERDRVTVGQRGAAALLWFQEYAVDKGMSSRRGQLNPDTLENKPVARVVASSTPGAETAQYYVTRAAEGFRTAILEKAIEFARADFERGEVRKADAQ